MLKLLRVSSLLLLCFLAHSSFASTRWDAQVAELSRKILALAPPANSSLEIRNTSSLPADEVPAIRRALVDQLRAGGLPIRDNSSNVIRVTLSESVRGYLWIAEIGSGSDSKYAMLNIPKAENFGGTSAPLLLRRALVFSQAEQILDIAFWQSRDQRFLFVLDPSHVGIYRANGARWDLVQSVSVPHEVYPRDIRGRLRVGEDGDWTAYLPGIQCSGPAQLQQPMTCRDSDDPWWLTDKYKAFYNSSRNYFTGATVPPLPSGLPTFYVAIQPRHGNSSFWVYASTDNKYYALDGSSTTQIAGTKDWGSDAAAVRSGCGSGTQLLVTAAGDDSATDSIRAFEVGERDARAVGPPVTFDGSVTVLWPSNQGDSAFAVLRTQTGSYEAYSVSVACNQ